MKSFFYKLKDCEENSQFEKRSINGIVLSKSNWYVSPYPADKLKSFLNILDFEENDPEEMERKKHLELIKKLEEESLQKEKQLLAEKEELAKQKVIEIQDLPKKAQKQKAVSKPIVETITNDFGDIIDVTKIKQLASEKIEFNPYTKQSERDKYKNLTKREIVDIILETDLKNYSRNDFKNSSKDDVLLTMYQVKNI